MHRLTRLCAALAVAACVTNAPNTFMYFPAGTHPFGSGGIYWAPQGVSFGNAGVSP